MVRGVTHRRNMELLATLIEKRINKDYKDEVKQAQRATI